MRAQNQSSSSLPCHMSSLVTSPAKERLSSMDTDEKKQATVREGGLKSRLQCRSFQGSRTRGLCFEELSQWSHSLEKLIASKYGTKVFQAFLKSEFSDENMEFWLVCEEYKKIRSSYRMTCKAEKIFKLYIQVEAPREINIDHRTRELIRRNLKTGGAGCFDEAQRIVFKLMEGDSYPRFLRSDIYRAIRDSI
ncbi:regulator of G-protein signaling 13-like [Hippocampus comes]|uniref:Regulator of G protein signaling 13a n=1 Tax=Hippocampus comes TaxID=109280 RepID=A0A3Q2YKX9_HIPCM|nr:PREDICTED: regulator of G-protein signaling 13-like [Hippocampus comes]